jgi:hypothetical protein
VSEGSECEARVVARALPPLLLDSCNPSDVVNRLIVELVKTDQRRPRVLFRFLHRVSPRLALISPRGGGWGWEFVQCESCNCSKC